MLKRTTTWITGLACAFTLSATVSAAEITVYTSLEEDEVAHYLEVAKQDMPDLEVNVLRLSTGDLGARILAESDNPASSVDRVLPSLEDVFIHHVEQAQASEARP